MLYEFLTQIYTEFSIISQTIIIFTTLFSTCLLDSYCGKGSQWIMETPVELNKLVLHIRVGIVPLCFR